MFEKSLFGVVATLAPSILIGSSSYLEVTRIVITSRMSSNGHSSIFNFDQIFFILGSNKDNYNILDELNLSQIQPLTAELAAFECLKN